MSGASYAPLRVSLGPAASFTSRPAALLKAEAMIASQLASHPADPAWLQTQAKADVLEGKYDAAVQALRRALELQPRSPALLTDLATAYFQRAQQEDRKEDFGAAYEYLSQALHGQPDDPVALFNRAIVAEHQFLYQQALEGLGALFARGLEFAMGRRSPEPCERGAAKAEGASEQDDAAALSRRAYGHGRHQP